MQPHTFTVDPSFVLLTHSPRAPARTARGPAPAPASRGSGPCVVCVDGMVME